MRRGVATFGGSIVAAGSGFALAVLVGRGLGPAGAGVFFSIVALTTIASTSLKLGTDTAQLWHLPRLVSAGRGAELRASLRDGLVPVAALSLVAATALLLGAGPLAERLADGDATAVVQQVRWAALALATTAPMLVLIAATRGLGLVGPFVLVQNMGLPLARLIVVAAVLASGAGGVAVVAAWSLPVAVATVAAGLLLTRELRRFHASSLSTERPPAAARTERRRSFWAFAGPRGVTASIEVVLVSVNTIVVGLFVGPAAAGVFGALSRFVTTGTLAEQAVRVLVAPRFSAMLGQGDTAGASRLASVTTPWIVLVSWPVFIVAGVGAPVLLGVFGPGFVTGATALAVLAAAMAVSLLAGNVQTILLMSGHSGMQLLNRVIAVLVLVALDLALIPRHGLLGAAIAWAASILVDTLLAVVEVRRMVGIAVGSPLLWKVTLSAVVAFGPVTYLAVHRAGLGLVGLVLAAVVGATFHLPTLWRSRRELAFEFDPRQRDSAATDHS